MAPAAARSKAKHVGASLTRLEDRPLLTGRGRFAADISFPHQLHMRIVRSNFAHGRLRAIDADAALALPGVHTVWAAANVADIPPIDTLFVAEEDIHVNPLGVKGIGELGVVLVEHGQAVIENGAALYLERRILLDAGDLDWIGCCDHGRAKGEVAGQIRTDR